MSEDFIVIGENIHCTRVLRRDGKRVDELEGGAEGIRYTCDGETRHLVVPDAFREGQAYTEGKLKHVAIAVHQGMRADGDAQRQGIEYLRWMAERQAQAGAAFLDVNVDELSPDLAERCEAMQWIVSVLHDACDTPLAIDSSSLDVLKAGLDAYDDSNGRALVNSVSLERPDVLDLVKDAGCRVLANAVGVGAMPADADQRIANLAQLMARADDLGIPYGDIFLDNLVLPIGTDSRHGLMLLDATRQARQRWGQEIHLTGGLSNISFGVPKRKLMNEVFMRLFIEAGGDSGIVDPLQVKVDKIRALDPEAESFKLAREALEGRDEFCMNYLMASRDGRLG